MKIWENNIICMLLYTCKYFACVIRKYDNRSLFDYTNTNIVADGYYEFYFIEVHRDLSVIKKEGKETHLEFYIKSMAIFHSSLRTSINVKFFHMQH